MVPGGSLGPFSTSSVRSLRTFCIFFSLTSFSKVLRMTSLIFMPKASASFLNSLETLAEIVMSLPNLATNWYTVWSTYKYY